MAYAETRDGKLTGLWVGTAVARPQTQEGRLTGAICTRNSAPKVALVSVRHGHLMEEQARAE
jgi:hypothetical protein